MKSSSHFHAVWDRDEKVVALYFGHELHEGAAPTFYVYRGRSITYGTPVAELQFLGVFHSRLPDAPRKPPETRWRYLPPWIMLPVRGNDIFDLKLVATADWEGPRETILRFSPAHNFEFPPGRATELGIYTIYGEMNIGTPEEGPRTVQQLWIYDSDSGFDSGFNRVEEFVDDFVGDAANRKMSIRLMLAHLQIDNEDNSISVGPSSRIFPRREREILVSAALPEIPYPAEAEFFARADEFGGDASFLETRAFRHFVFSRKSYPQPSLTVQLGTAPEQVEQRREAVAFVHVRQNAWQYNKDSDSVLSADAAERRRIYRDIQPRAITAINGRDQAVKVVPVASGVGLSHTFADVSLGDIVGVEARDGSRLRYNSTETSLGGRAIFFRFLVDSLVPMDPDQVLDKNILGSLLSQALTEDESRPRPQAGRPQRRQRLRQYAQPRRLVEIMHNAVYGELIALEMLPGGERSDVGRLRDALTWGFFSAAPQATHVLTNSSRFRRMVKDPAITGEPEPDEPFVRTAIRMIDPMPGNLAWAAALTDTGAQVAAWEIMASCPEFIGLCAEYNLRPGMFRGPGYDYGAVLVLLQNPASVRRAVRIYEDFGLTPAAKMLQDLLEGIEKRTGVDFDTLQLAARAEKQAWQLLREDLERANKIGHMLGDQADEWHVAALEDFRGGAVSNIDRRQLREEIAKLLEARVERSRLLEAQQLLMGIKSAEALFRLKDRVTGEDPRAATRDLVNEYAERICAWAEILPPPSDQRRMTRPSGADEEQAPHREWLSKAGQLWQSQLPRSVTIRELSNSTPNAEDIGYPDELRPVADALRRLIAQAEAAIEKHTSRRVAPNDLGDQVRDLEALANAALAVKIGQHLQAFATTCHDNFRHETSRGQRGRRRDLANHWDLLGRSLAPDRFPAMLEEALRNTRVFALALNELVAKPPEGPFAGLKPIKL